MKRSRLSKERDWLKRGSLCIQWPSTSDSTQDQSHFRDRVWTAPCGARGIWRENSTGRVHPWVRPVRAAPLVFAELQRQLPTDFGFSFCGL